MSAIVETTQGLDSIPGQTFSHLPSRPPLGRSATRSNQQGRKSGPGRSPSPSSSGGRLGTMAVGTKGRIAPGLQHRLACLAGETPAESPVSTVPRGKMDQVEAERPAEGLGASPCVAVITTVGCSYCAKVKTALREENIPFEEVELSSNLELLRKIKETTGRRTVPQVFVGGQLIGGAEETIALMKEGDFQMEVLKAGNTLPLPPDLQQALLQAREEQQVIIEDGLKPMSMSAEEYQRLKEVAEAMREPESGILRRENKLGWVTYENSFTQGDAWRWLMEEEFVTTHEEADNTLTKLVLAHLVSPAETEGDPSLGPDMVLRLVAEAPPPRLGHPLNRHFMWVGPARPAAEVAEGLRQRILALYNTYLAPDGRGVNYKRLSQDPAFAEYVDATAELQKVDVSGLTRDERMAFYINTYNALVIHGLAVFGPAEGTIQRLSWFNAVKYDIAGMSFSANDIEHGILRGNRSSPASFGSLLGFKGGHYFRSDDPRVSQICLPMDPRIHFSLVCGAKSCPPIRVYTAEGLEEGLTAAACAFCEGAPLK
eukprot:jgi/Botrbrau1/3986/Bobra.0365s0058.2